MPSCPPLDGRRCSATPAGRSSRRVSAWERLAHPDDRLALTARTTAWRGAERPTRRSFVCVTRTGITSTCSRAVFLCTASPGGRSVGIVGTHFNLTERKRAEAELLENEERLKLAFAGAQEGVWDWNLDTGAVVSSSRWKEILGYADDEIEPHVRAWERLLHPDDVAPAQRVNESVKRGASTYEGEFRLRHKDGHYVHVLSRGYPVRRDPGGPVVRIVGTHYDLTERKRAEAERARTEVLTRLVFAQEESGGESGAKCTINSASS